LLFSFFFCFSFVFLLLSVVLVWGNFNTCLWNR
jgi:hypothetical protein